MNAQEQAGFKHGARDFLKGNYKPSLPGWDYQYEIGYDSGRKAMEKDVLLLQVKMESVSFGADTK